MPKYNSKYEWNLSTIGIYLRLEFNEEKNDAELCFKTSGVPCLSPCSVSCYKCYNLFNLKIWMSANKNFPVHLQAPVFVPIESAKKLQLLPNWHIFRLKTLRQIV